LYAADLRDHSSVAEATLEEGKDEEEQQQQSDVSKLCGLGGRLRQSRLAKRIRMVEDTILGSRC